MRRGSGFFLVSVGILLFAVYGLVMFHAVSLLGSILHVLGINEFMIFVDPVIPPVCAGLMLVCGILLLRHRPPRQRSKV